MNTRFFKNIPRGERLARIIVGIVALGGGLVWALSGSLIAGLLAGGSGIVLVATGFVGWCPICAVAGRKLPESLQPVKWQRVGD